MFFQTHRWSMQKNLNYVVGLLGALEIIVIPHTAPSGNMRIHGIRYPSGEQRIMDCIQIGFVLRLYLKTKHTVCVQFTVSANREEG